MISFDIDDDAINAVVVELGATPGQVIKAKRRAISRTTKTLRKHSLQGLKGVLGLRKTKNLKRRINVVSVRAGRGSEMEVWFGLNPMTVPDMKGAPKTVEGGAEFRDEYFDRGFVAKSPFRKKKGVFRRRTDARDSKLDAMEVDIRDKGEIFIEDNLVGDPSAEMFLHHFFKDLHARVVHGVGK